MLFVNDISVRTSCQKNSNLNGKFNLIMEKEVNWMNDHNLEIFKKNKIHSNRVKKRPLEGNLYYNGTKFESSSQFTLLGLVINTNINWKAHTESKI